jgi:hypothetical protein
MLETSSGIMSRKQDWIEYMIVAMKPITIGFLEAYIGLLLIASDIMQ